MMLVSDKHFPNHPSRRHALKVLAASAGVSTGFPLLGNGAISNSLPLGPGEPALGAEVDLAPFGHFKSWDGNRGVEWDEPRDIWRVEFDFSSSKEAHSSEGAAVEYWVRGWPPLPRGGWTVIDTPSQGKWLRITGQREVQGSTLIFRCAPLSAAENPNTKNDPGYQPSFRRTLKIRLRLNDRSAHFSRLRAYSNSRWALREIGIQTGCGEMKAFEPRIKIYNGIHLSSTPIDATPENIRLRVLYTDHDPASNDRTILTIQGAERAFGVSVDDVIQRKGAYVRPFGVFIGDASNHEDWHSFQKSAQLCPGEDIISRTSRHVEQSLANAMGEIPRLALTARKGSHPLRYIPLGFTGSREKYGLDFNGNVFISKHGTKAMKEDLARMLWNGDEIYFRIGSGKIPDFREREVGTRQCVLEDYLPLVTTNWENGGIEYAEKAYATMLDAPLDESQLRGDEPSVLLIHLEARNKGSKTVPAHVWFQVSPPEKLELKDGLLLGTADEKGPYVQPRLRAVLESSVGALKLLEVEGYTGLREPAPRGAHAVVWTVSLPAHSSAILETKIPFRTIISSSEQNRVKNVRFETRLEETLAYWRKATSQGMQLQVPDEPINTFFRAVLQHVLVSQEKDVKTGYTMCPCGTYDYNVFANETDIQIRLLNMRGLHDAAWRCLRPLVELQGSKPFPGLFTDVSAELHGVRVDKDHDYTMGGYNLDHGWTLWTLADHYFFERDQDWLRKVMPHLMKAANWIIDERKATMRRGSNDAPVPEFGLLPVGDLEDNDDWEHWFAINAYGYRGLARAAEAVAEVDPAEGSRLKSEAAAYRRDIRAAAFRAMAIAPVVPLRDGAFVPMIPPRTSLHGRDLGWIRNVLYGAHTLVDCGVLSLEEHAATWTLQDYEDNLFMAPDSLSVPDRDWFSRGGVALQPNLVNTCVSYLKRDQLPQAIRAFYNDFVISHYPDVNSFTEWIPTLGIGGGPFFKTSDESAFFIWLRLMLVREEGQRLYLNSGAPKDWFLPGRIIQIDCAATFFGETGFRVEAHPDDGFIEARVSLPQRNRPREVRLRLRHPDSKKIIRVELNGQAWNQFNAEQEMISLPPQESTCRLRAYF